MQTPKHDKVRSRNEAFAQKTATRIWYEEPSADNPFIAARALCHGYDLLELMQKRSIVDVFYLLFRGELPSAEQAQLLQQLMIGLINPGPRHPATRAAMNAGIGKSDPVHILPIASAVFGGEYQGAGEIDATMRFLRKQQHSDPAHYAMALLEQVTEPSPGDSVPLPIPGFGRCYGGVDLLAKKIAGQLLALPAAGKALHWAVALAQALEKNGIGISNSGIAAAVFADLGFQPRAGGCLYQLLSAPGLVAQGIELANKPITAMPFINDDNYFIER